MPSRLTSLAYLVVVTAACGSDDPSSQRPDAGSTSDAREPEVPPDAQPIVVPSNGGLLEQTGLVVAPPSGTFSTTTDCITPSVLGACATVAQPDGPELCVCRADRFTIGALAVTGTRPLVLLAWEDVVIAGTLDVGASGARPGPGSLGAYATTATSLTGGAGGSFASAGGHGGAAVFGTASQIPLLGGMRGENGCNSVPGGGGGGALQISAGRAISVTGTILAGGGGGSGGSSTGTCLGAAGGGSGGGILLEAPSVIVSGAVAANGGGGGGGGANGFGGGGFGSDARALPGSGGAGNDGHGCALGGFTSGGDGGFGASGTNAPGSGGSSDVITGCLGSNLFVGEGAGGGGLGRIRVNTEVGCQCSGTFSPAPSIGTLVVH